MKNQTLMTVLVYRLYYHRIIFPLYIYKTCNDNVTSTLLVRVWRIEAAIINLNHDGNSFAKYRDIRSIINILVGTTTEFLSGNGIPSQKCPRTRSRTIKFGLNVRTHGTPENNCLHVDYILTRNGTERY